MSFACQLIGNHPEVQKKLHDEIDQVLGKFIQFVFIKNSFKVILLNRIDK